MRTFCTEVPILSNPRDLIEYVVGLEAAGPFKAPVPRKSCPAYYTRIKQPIDLGAILKKAKAGAYDVPSDGSSGDAASSASSSTAVSKGAAAMWNDLRLLISNAKKFNQPEVRTQLILYACEH